MERLLKQLRARYPKLQFVKGQNFCWTPKDQKIFYKPGVHPTDRWRLLHEVGHATLGHQMYQGDIELLTLEIDAWQCAQEIAPELGLAIDDNFIQDCLDTYRDWLHRRSTCPSCGTHSLQQSPEQYHCHNCQESWHVSASRFCRSYRAVHRSHKRPYSAKQATFS